MHERRAVTVRKATIPHVFMKGHDSNSRQVVHHLERVGTVGAGSEWPVGFQNLRLISGG